MNHSNLKIDRAFLFFLFFGVFFLPAISIGGGDLDVEDIVLSFFIVIFFVGKRFVIRREFLFIILFFIFQSFMLLLSYNVSDLIYESDRLIPLRWFEMYGKREILSFFKPLLQSYFQLAILFICLIVFFIGSYLSRVKTLDRYIVVLLQAFLFVNLLLVLYEFLYLKERASGVTGNPQALGVVVNTILLFVFYLTKNSFIRASSFIMVTVIILASGTNSSFVCLIAILLFLLNRSGLILKLSLYSVVAINFLVTVFFVLIFGDEIVYFLSYIFSDTSSFLIRVLMWSSAFYNIIMESPVFGLYGRISEFPDNIIWYFLVPYGFLGFFVFLMFFYRLSIVNNKYLNLLILVMFLQGVSYYGYMVKPMSYIFWFCLGFMYERAISVVR